MGAARGLGTRGATFAARPATRLHRAPPTCSPSTTTRCWPPTSTGAAVAASGCAERSPRRPARAGPPGVLRLGDHRRRRRRADRRHHRAPARGRRRRRRPARGTRVQGRARPGRREDRLRPHVRRHGPHPRPAAARRGGEAKVTGDRRLRRRRRRRRRRGRGRPDRAGSAAWRACGSATRSARGRRRRGATTSRRRRSRRSSSPARPRDRGALHVALDPARRAGPADQPAPGRRPPARSRVSLYGEVQKEVIQATLAERVRRRRRLPRDDDDLHRARRPAPARPSRSSARTPTRSWPRSACGSSPRRPAPASRSRSRSSSARCRYAFFRAVEETVRARRSARASTAGRCRTAGDDDALRLLGEAEPLARRLRQEHVEHRRRLPPPDAARR